MCVSLRASDREGDRDRGKVKQYLIIIDKQTHEYYL